MKKTSAKCWENIKKYPILVTSRNLLFWCLEVLWFPEPHDALTCSSKYKCASETEAASIKGQIFLGLWKRTSRISWNCSNITNCHTVSKINFVNPQSMNGEYNQSQFVSQHWRNWTTQVSPAALLCCLVMGKGDLYNVAGKNKTGKSSSKIRWSVLFFCLPCIFGWLKLGRHHSAVNGCRLLWISKMSRPITWVYNSNSFKTMGGKFCWNKSNNSWVTLFQK